MMHAAIFRTAMLLVLAALGASAATAQTDFSFAAGVDSTGRAQALSNADGQVLIESPQYPHGLWLHLVDEAGDALAGLQVEYQGRPDSLVAIRCVDPAGSVRETLIWSRPEGDPLRLTLKPREASDDLSAGLAPIDWQIDPAVVSLLEPVAETRLESWEAAADFLPGRWQGQTGRVAIQLDASTSFAVELDRPKAVETLVDRLKQSGISLGEGYRLGVQVYKGSLDLLEGAIFYTFLFEDANLERMVRQALGRPQGRLTSEAITSLTELSASRSAVQSLAGLEHFTALQRLSLHDNQIADVEPLANLTNLHTLDLAFNQIADVEPLANLTNLHTLWLGFNQIADVEPLANLTNLHTLWLGFNQIADVGPLANLTNLHTLDLEYNQIADVGPLANLTNLHTLDLEYNQIEDLTSLIANPGLNEGDRIYLTGNPLSDQALNEQIPALKARGVHIEY